MTVLASDYQARLIAVRAAMRTRGLEALIVYSWKRGQVRYLTGYRPNYIANVAAALLPLVGDATLFIRFPFDLERARRACWFDDVRASGDVPGIGRDIVDWLKAHGLAEAKVGLGAGDMVMDEWPHSLHQQIAAALPPELSHAGQPLVGGKSHSPSSLISWKACSTLSRAGVMNPATSMARAWKYSPRPQYCR